MAGKKKLMTVKTKLPLPSQAIESLGVGMNGRVQRFVTREVFERLQPYIPKKSGDLRASARIADPTHIAVDSEYARVQFFGVTRSGLPFDYDTAAGGPKAGSHWDRRLVAYEGAAIAQKVTRRFGMRGGIR